MISRRWLAATSLSLLVVACSSAQPSASPTPSPSVAISVPTATPSPIAVPATPSPSAMIPPGESRATTAPRCAGSQLQIAYLLDPSGAAAGSWSMVLGIRDDGVRACSLRGWPALQFLAVNGAALPTHEEETTTDFSLSTPLSTVVLQSGTPPLAGDSQPGYAYIEIAGDDTLAPCETAVGIRIVPPGLTDSFVANLRVPMMFPTGQVVCSGGRVMVVPIHS